MATQVTLDHEAECLIVRSEGRALNDTLLAELVDRLRDEASEAHTYNALYDYRSIRDAGDLSADTVRVFAEMECKGDPGKAEEKRVAIVTQSEALFGMSRMFQAFADSRLPELRVFRDIDLAYEYVGVAPAE